MLGLTMKRFVLLLATAVTVLFVAACSGATSSPEKAAKSFVEKVYAGDADGAVKMIHIPEEERQQAGMEELVAGKIKSSVARQKAFAEQHGGVDGIEVEEAEQDSRDDKRAVVQLAVKFKDGQIKPEQVKVIKTDDGWKIRL